MKLRQVPSPRLVPKIKEKTWNSKLEAGIFKRWERERIYRFDIRAKKIFSIDTPPPYPSGRPWHIGAAAHYSQIDMIARTARMMGNQVLFPIGIDRNGLPVELYTERTYGVNIRTTPRERFIELCRHALDDLEAEMIGIMKMMGMSGDFKNHYRTDDEEYRRLTQSTFIELWRRGLVYEATRPNNYCPDCGTTIADAEIEYQELPSKLVYMKFRFKEAPGELIVASTRPELLCSCQTVIVNAEDERFKKYHGARVIIPIYEREVEVRSHPSANPEFGSGAAMICSYGDYTDVLLFRELRLKEIVAIDENDRMTESSGILAGLKVSEAREKIIEELQKSGSLEKIEEISHRMPVCERSQTPIEIIPMNEYYLKQLDFIPTLRKIALKMIFHPDSHRQLLLNWLDSISIDWPVSRRRYYGTEVPIWYCKKDGEPHLPSPGKYYRPWKDKAPFAKCNKCGSTEFIGDPRTFDTWMDSSVSPLFITKYSRSFDFFNKTYPATLRAQGKNIVRTWLHYTILRCYQLTKKAPFARAWIFGLGLDEHGLAMSKSRGNVLDPIPILEKFGGDNLRFWSASEANLGYDFRCSEARIEGAGKFLTKLWNISRFISSYPRPKKVKLTTTDRWILAELSILVKSCLDGYKDFNFFIPANKIRDFVWNIFASHYVEMVKARAYGQSSSTSQIKAAWFTLHACLSTVLRLLAPIAPFITEAVWRELYGKRSIHLESFPTPAWNKSLRKYSRHVVEFNEQVWKLKRERNLSLRDPIELKVPKGLKLLEQDLRVMHNLR